ncbi:hypothetical protein PISMIDRAFT_97435 [Pisolithus microcarpus 441]|uniref:Uncharacterized protein n=1 Tax=Pisolithus microcarpus 441 TaxID=765257 RepID=A0A0C9YJD0_9AGAM|nr:hypothetical protein PISMIDRAFT_97435 [Pisolithus microcarpus 441]
MIPRSPVKRTQSNGSVKDVPSKSTLANHRTTPTTPATAPILTTSTATGSKATPYETMVAAQQTHINELVQKTRSLENEIEKLTEQLERTTAESAAFVSERGTWETDRKAWASERQKWIDERKVWVEGCDTMQACHRIQQYRMACALDDERVTVLRMRDEARKEQLQRLQRDYKITTFQAREADLEVRIAELEDMHANAEAARAQCEKVSQALETKCTALLGELNAKTAEIQSTHKQHERAEEELRRLREALADASAATTSSTSKLTRITAQRDALQAQVTSLQQSLEAAQDESIQLRTQLTNWQNLKQGKDAEGDALRQKKAELESEIMEANKRISEMEARVEEFQATDARLQKEKGRVDKLKVVLEEWKTEANEQTNAREEAETQLANANARINTLELELADTRLQLASAKSQVSYPPVPQNRKPSPSVQGADEPDSDIVVTHERLVTTGKPKSKKTRPPSVAEASSSKPGSSSKPRPKPRPVKCPSPIPDAPEDVEIIEIRSLSPVQDPSRKPSSKAKGKRPVIDLDSEDDGDMPAAEQPLGKKRNVTDKVKDKDKSKEVKHMQARDVFNPLPGERLDNDRSKPKSKHGPKKRPPPESTSESVSKPKKTKPKSPQYHEDEEDAVADNTDPVPRKKKRRINLFPASQPSTFDWDSFPQVNGEGLGIPTRLSPMKNTDAVPRRLGRSSGG